MKVIGNDKRYLLAVSGGADSMAMLDMFYRYRPQLQFDVLTINHHLRPTAHIDCQLVADYCASNGINCLVRDINVQSYCQQNALSVETGARLLRRQLYEQLAVNYDFVCLAHNKDDNAESVLMHILRGSGLKGAEGIRRLQGKYYRPLLDYTKAELEQYCIYHNVPFVVDESNADTLYRRNFIRQAVLPLLKQYNSGVVDNLVRFAHNVQGDNQLLDSLVDISSVQFEDDKTTVPCELLQSQAMTYRVLSKVFVRLGYTCDIEKKHFDDIYSLAHNNSGKRINLPFELTAIKQYHNIVIAKGASQDNSQCVQYCYPFKVGQILTPYGIVNISKAQPTNSQQVVGRVLYFDLDKVSDRENIVIRDARQGDKFTKFGGGSKMLNRYFTDIKLANNVRKTIPLIARNSDILAICGVEISKLVTTDEQSNKYYIYITREENS